MTPGLLPLAALIVGAIVGSFLNVVIVRLPLGESLVRPGSRCRACAAPISWHDNIPVASFLALQGRCRACGNPIGWRYPAVEAGTGALWALAAAVVGPSPALLPTVLLLALLVAATGIDLDHLLIPDAITLPGLGVGLVMAPLLGGLAWFDSLLGALLGGGLLLVVILLSRGGMGGGDMKLGAMFGSFLGWKATLLALVLAAWAGGLVACWLLLRGRRRRKDALPFGPFLAIGGALALLWGKPLLAWYLGIGRA